MLQTLPGLQENRFTTLFRPGNPMYLILYIGNISDPYRETYQRRSRHA